jgi:hypothetical protein
LSFCGQPRTQWNIIIFFIETTTNRGKSALTLGDFIVGAGLRFRFQGGIWWDREFSDAETVKILILTRIGFVGNCQGSMVPCHDVRRSWAREWPTA